jgi:hypothetical protein
MNTLPPTIGFGQSAGNRIHPSVSAHAQNFGVSRLNQQKERDKASVSMGRVTREKQYGAGSGPSTSIDHILRGETAPQQDDYGVYSDEQQEEIRTRLRYQHIRALMRDKKAEEIEEAKKEKRAVVLEKKKNTKH